MRALFVLFLLAACGTTYSIPEGSGPAPAPVAVVQRGGGSVSVAQFNTIQARVEGSAEAFCRAELPGQPGAFCDYDIRLLSDPRLPPNAFQTIGPNGRPLVGFTRTLLAEAVNADEVAFVLSHEAGHHIAQHIPRQQQQQALGALIFGGLASITGGEGVSRESVSRAMNIGASLGGRVYSQTFELEADTLGAFIAARAGYDPARGAALFTSPSMANSRAGLLSTHPPSAQRLATVQRVSEQIRRQQAQGLTPSPGRADPARAF